MVVGLVVVVIPDVPADVDGPVEELPVPEVVVFEDTEVVVGCVVLFGVLVVGSTVLVVVLVVGDAPDCSLPLDVNVCGMFAV